MKAYPKKDSAKPYITSFCYICDDEYLTQGIVDNEKEKCPTCKDKHICYSCEEVFDFAELTETGDCEFECDYCYQPTCLACSEPVEEDGMVCSDWCRGVLKYDNRDKTL
tara:strand:+ start:188 stop:514 length:327 start_codon:yes stop_codon:yes gene_type:complete